MSYREVMYKPLAAHINLRYRDNGWNIGRSMIQQEKLLVFHFSPGM